MASTGKCPYCGALVRSDQASCPGCGAPNELFVADTPRTIFRPQTIEELQEYCAERGMPLLRMRFFIGEDFREPRAFGIYRDGADVVVYKNKADGTRAIRYRGPDEARGVTELYRKLQEECARRGIYPDGRPPERGTRPAPSPSVSSRRQKRSSFSPLLLVVVLFVALSLVSVIRDRVGHAHDGYYTVSDEHYYRYGDDWYYSGGGSDWTEIYAFPEDNYEDYYAGSSWDSDWGVSDFRDSDAWDEIRSSGSSSSSDAYDSSDSYDDWDSGDTDWDSDW